MKLLAPLALAASLIGSLFAPSASQPTGNGPDWRTADAWYDGQAEMCVYEATRSIYGIERRYEARAYTNKQLMDPRTTTKATGREGVEVFKHHWSERVPTEAYDYDFSTASFTRTDDLSAFKLTVATQEDCGASFKQVTREGDRLSYFESTYFPGGGVREGRLGSAQELAFQDSLTLTLRDFPFEGLDDEPRELALLLVPSQKEPRPRNFEAVSRRVRHAGRETLQLPAGEFAAHRLELLAEDGEVVATYWFAADGSAPLLHALLRYEGPGGTSYVLKSHTRTAYWERG